LNAADHVTISGTNSFAGGLKATAERYVAIGNADAAGTQFYPTQVDAGNIMLTAKTGNIGIAGVVNSQGQLRLNAQNGSIYTATNALASADSPILNANTYIFNAAGDVVDIVPTVSDVAIEFVDAVKNGKPVDKTGAVTLAGKANDGNFNLVAAKANNANLKAKGNIAILQSDIKNNLDVQADAILMGASNVGNNANLTASKEVSTDSTGKVTVGGDLNVKSNGFVSLDNVIANNVDVKADGNARFVNSEAKNNATIKSGIDANQEYKHTYIDNVKVGNNLNASSDSSYVDVRNANAKSADLNAADHVTISGTNSFAGGLKATAERYVAIGNADAVGTQFYPTQVDAGNIMLTAKTGNIGIAGVVNSTGDLVLNAQNGSIYTATNALASADSPILNASTYIFNAAGDVVDIVPTVSDVAIEFVDAVKNGKPVAKTGAVTLAGASTLGSYKNVTVNANNANLKANGTIVIEGDIKNDLTASSDVALGLKDVKVGNHVEASANEALGVQNLNAKSANLTSSNGYVGVWGNNVIENTLNIQAEKAAGIAMTTDIMNPLNPTFNEFIPTTLKSGTLNINSNNGNVGLAGVITVDGKAVITAGNGSIYTAANSIADGQNILSAAEYELTVKDEIADIVPSTSAKAEDFVKAVLFGRDKNNTTTSAVAIKGGELKVNATDASFKVDGDVNINNTKVTNNLNVTSTGTAKVDTTTTSNLNIKADKNIDAKNIKANNATLEAGEHLIVTGSNEITDTFKATSNDYLIIGNSNSEYTAFENTTLNAKDIQIESKNGNVGLAGVITADNNITVTANNGSIYTATNAIANGENILNASSYNLTAKNEIADIIPTNNEKIAYEFIDAVINGRTPTKTGNVTIQGGDLDINSNEAKIKSEEDLNVNSGNVNDLQVEGDNSIKVGKDVEFENLDIKAGKDAELERTGDYVINPDSGVKIEAGESATIKTDGNLVVENMDDSTIKAPNQNYEADKNIEVKGNNNFNGDVTVKSNDGGNVNISTDGGKTNVTNGGLTVDTEGDAKVNNVDAEDHIIVKNAENIDITNSNTDHLAIINTPDNRFDEAHISNTNANTTEFAHGEDLYIDLSGVEIFGNDRPSIIGSAFDVDRIHIYPTLGGGDAFGGGTEGPGQWDDASRLMNEFRSKGISSHIGDDFAPIAFAAHTDRKGGIVRKKIGEAVFKDIEQTVHVTERFDMHD